MPPEPYPYKPDPATGKQRAEILRLIGGRWDFPDGFSAREARELIYSLRQGAKQPKPEQWVYFIQAGSEGPIKIGIADSPALRLSELQTGKQLPVTLLKAVPGGKDLETELHRELAAYRLCREWFEATAEVLATAWRRIGCAASGSRLRPKCSPPYKSGAGSRLSHCDLATSSNALSNGTANARSASTLGTSIAPRAIVWSAIALKLRPRCRTDDARHGTSRGSASRSGS